MSSSLATTPLQAEAPRPIPPPSRRRGFAPALTPAGASAVIAVTVVLGLTGDALFFDGMGPGSFTAWMALLALNVVGLAERADRELSRESLAWFALSIAFAFATVWRNADFLVFFDVVASIGCLIMAGIRLREPDAALLAPRFRNTIRAGLHGFGDAFGGFLPLLFQERPRRSAAGESRDKYRAFIRAAVVSAFLAFVFGALLRDADPIFASFLNFPFVDIKSLPQHIFVSVACAWFAAGWLRSALARDREIYETELPEIALRSLDVVAALGTLNVLFALYVVAQLGWIFGGETFLHSRTGLTAAEYARRGFFEMAWVVALVVPVLVFTRGAVQSDRAALRTHTWLSLPLIAMLGVMIVSALLRMKLYVHFYGLTTDRLYPLVFMSWLAFVLAWLAATVLRDRGRTFIAGVATSGIIVLGGLNLIDVERIVADVNVARHDSGVAVQPLDLIYLSRLGGSAIDVATNAIIAAPSVVTASNPIAPRCVAAENLLSRWGRESESQRQSELSAAWRFWNHDDAHARRVVQEHEAALHMASPAACFKTKAESK